MKKLKVLAVSVIALLTLAACGNKDAASSSNNEDVNTSQKEQQPIGFKKAVKDGKYRVWYLTRIGKSESIGERTALDGIFIMEPDGNAYVFNGYGNLDDLLTTTLMNETDLRAKWTKYYHDLDQRAVENSMVANKESFQIEDIGLKPYKIWNESGKYSDEGGEFIQYTYRSMTTDTQSGNAEYSDHTMDFKLLSGGAKFTVGDNQLSGYQVQQGDDTAYLLTKTDQTFELDEK